MAKGTTFRGPDGQIAIRTGPAVAVGQYFVFDPDNGGYYENADDKVAEIEAWPQLSPAEAPAPTPAPTPVAPPTPPSPAAAPSPTPAST
jgi:hypothetical protein